MLPPALQMLQALRRGQHQAHEAGDPESERQQVTTPWNARVKTPRRQTRAMPTRPTASGKKSRVATAGAPPALNIESSAAPA